MEDLKEDYQLALEGRGCWLKLKEKYKMDDHCCLIICPTDNPLLNRIAMDNLIIFLKRKYLEKAVILSPYPYMKKYIMPTKEKEIYFVHAEKHKMESILKYYRLTQFTKNIVVISLEEPYGNDNLIGKKGITLVDYVKNAIYV